MNNPQIVIFDLDNTFYEYRSCHNYAQDLVIAYLCRELKLPQSTITKYLKKAREEIKNELSGASSHSRILYFHRFVLDLIPTDQPKLILEADSIYWNSFLKRMELANGARHFLLELRIRGIKTVLVTDLTLEIQLRKLIRLQIDTLFDVIITSEDAGDDKVSQKPFELAWRYTDKSYDCAWFIGDSVNDFPTTQIFHSQFFFKSPYSKEKFNFPHKSYRDFFYLKKLM